jgi:NAD(P)H-dependent FMN reductase
MNGAPRVLAFAGSTRRESLNRALAAAGARAVEAAGLRCTLIALRDYPLPIYDGDLEADEGLPPNALRLKALFAGHDGLLIASPEYNSAISPLLKNVIDWVSRSEAGAPDISPYHRKVAALLAASPGRLGGLRGLATVRSILGNIGVTVIPEQFALAHAHEALDPQGELVNEADRGRLRGIAESLVRTVSRLAAA